ncbi:aspartyl-phosphate phosphatase Spo0E family protein [Desulforamulus putei]|uniref:Spo0E family sporulation regulatory protein-aspartic acid phosphatase n=1 Tax=Desulforamulus putei TaxID=74701 RepID=UPI001160A3D2
MLKTPIINKLYELIKHLNIMAIPDNLHSEAVLEISREIDTLILEFYSSRMEEQEITASDY